MGFTQTKSDHCLYVNSEGELFIIEVYIDYILLAGKDKRKMDEIKRTRSSQFEVKDMGELHYFLGVKVIQNHEERSIWIGQPTYTSSIMSTLVSKKLSLLPTMIVGWSASRLILGLLVIVSLRLFTMALPPAIVP